MDRKEEDYLRKHRSHDAAHVLQRWRAVARAAGLVMESIAEAGGYPVVALRNRRSVEGAGLYLSTGIHGDEPGAVFGLLEWAEANAERLRTIPVVIFPCVNPWGLVNNLRTDPAGRDLNRAFDRTCGEPICAMLDFIAGREFAMAASLHEDYDANGIYVYELGRRGESFGERLLEGVEKILPRHRGSVDGRRIQNGVMRRTTGLEKIAKMIEGMPEAIYLHFHHARTALTFETPSEFSLYERVRAHGAFLDGVAEILTEW
jgi:hypothetical protein